MRSIACRIESSHGTMVVVRCAKDGHKSSEARPCNPFSGGKFMVQAAIVEQHTSKLRAAGSIGNKLKCTLAIITASMRVCVCVCGGYKLPYGNGD